MAHELGFTVLAEGIETKEQYNYLKSKGCDSFQGYLLANRFNQNTPQSSKHLSLNGIC